MTADFALFAMVQNWQVIDNMTFIWAKSLAMEDDRVATIREAGKTIANMAAAPDSYKYLGDPGMCSNCHSRLMFIAEDGKTVECSVCGVKGELTMEDGKLKYSFRPEQMEHAHNLLLGKIKHVEDIGKMEGKFASEKKSDEYKRRADAYKAFIQPSKPDKQA